MIVTALYCIAKHPLTNYRPVTLEKKFIKIEILLLKYPFQSVIVADYQSLVTRYFQSNFESCLW